MLSKIKIWLASLGAFLSVLFYAKMQKEKADALEDAVEGLEEEIEVKGRIALAKEEVLTESLRRRSEIVKEIEDAKKHIEKNDLAYPDGKLDPSFVSLLNKSSNQKPDS